MYFMNKSYFQLENPYILPLFSYWVFLLLDMQSYGNYFYDYLWFVITGVLISMLRKNK